MGSNANSKNYNAALSVYKETLNSRNAYETEEDYAEAVKTALTSLCAYRTEYSLSNWELKSIKEGGKGLILVCSELNLSQNMSTLDYYLAREILEERSKEYDRISRR